MQTTEGCRNSTNEVKGRPDFRTGGPSGASEPRCLCAPTYLTTACNLVNGLLENRGDKTLARTLGTYTPRYDLFIVDESGYVSFSMEGNALLFQVFAERHERESVLVTTNLGCSSWTQVFGDPNMTAALLDRLTYKSISSNAQLSSEARQSLEEVNKCTGKTLPV
jgi:DNA replication protein DnaC